MSYHFMVHKFHFIFDHMKSAAFHVPVFMKVTSAEWHYYQITCTEFFSHWVMNVESMDRN